MFEQMVKDMHVPPEIFCELTDEQKYVLHYEIRQEQIRRYNEWQRSTDNVGNASKPKHKLKFSLKKKKVKHVNFIEGLDGKLQVQQIYLDPDNMVNE
ncbi:unnamed protein product [Dicrocoelium dendriticum]|nr:unnamed protein product [Dicrocoelium dendriticum]